MQANSVVTYHPHLYLDLDMDKDAYSFKTIVCKEFEKKAAQL